MTVPVAIIAAGVRTPLGLDAASSAAALRATISSCSEHPFMVDQNGEPMPASLDTQLRADQPCRERMLILTRHVLKQVCLSVPEHPEFHSIPLLLGLPEPRPGFSEQDAQWLQQQLLQSSDLPVHLAACRAYMSGHSATLLLMDQARGEMAQGKYDVCLIAGVESYFHPDTMEWLDENRQLLGTVSRSGFVPAEGAGCCLLMTPAAASRAGLPALAMLTGSATDWESKRIKTQEMNLGEALISTVRNVVGVLDSSRQKIHNVYCDINGERYRGEEWGFTCLKLAQYFDDPTAYCSPADCVGDMGAASGVLFAALAIQAAQRGYAAGSRSLLWTSSENGLRAAVMLEADVVPSPYRG